MTTASIHWAATEFEHLDLGDARLNKRAKVLMERFPADPMASIPKASLGWSETVATYRFFDNDSVDWRDLTVRIGSRRSSVWRRVELRAGKGKTVSATCVVARKIDAPSGATPVEWRLLSSCVFLELVIRHQR